MTAAFLRAPSITWFSLRWPRETTSEHILAALLALNGLSTPRRTETIVLRATGTSDGVQHLVGLPETRADVGRHQLQAAVSGLSVEPVDDDPGLRVERCWQAWVSTNRRPLHQLHAESISGALLTALASVEPDEHLVLQWWLGPVRRPMAGGSKVTGDIGNSLAEAVLRGPFMAPADLDAEARKALTSKQGLPGWRACLRIGVRATGVRRQRQLLGRVAAAVRMSQGPGVQLGFHAVRPSAMASTGSPWRWPLAINVGELKGLVAWPIGNTENLPVAHVRSRLLPPAKQVRRSGRVIAQATAPGHDRPLALGAQETEHLLLLGPTGVGKSTAMLGLIAQAMEAGHGVVVVEPKSDLVRDVLERIPQHRLDDVVLIDPTDSAVVGINPLARRGGQPEVVADGLLAIFTGLYGDAVGPRSHDILSSGLMTLAHTPGMSLVALPLLLTDRSFRQRLVNRLHDPVALGPFWQWFDDLSAAERAAVISPVQNKLRRLLLRERVRRVIGQVSPRFDIAEVFTKKRIVLVDASTGALGAEAAQLLGALVVSELWRAAQARSRIEPDKRHPVFVFIDEAASYLHLPTDLADVLTRARGLGVSLTMAAQHLAQFSPAMRAAVLANARNRLIFRTSLDDARTLVADDARLSPLDVTSLGKYEIYASLVADGEVTPWCSGRTLTPPPKTSDAGQVRARSREQWGVPVGQIDADIEGMVNACGAAASCRQAAVQDDERFGVVERGQELKDDAGHRPEDQS